MAAGAVAVLLAGGGVTYALVNRDASGGQELAGRTDGPAASSSAPGSPGASASGGKQSPGAKPTEQGPTKSPSQSAEPPAPGKGTGGSASGGSANGGSPTGDPALAPVCHSIGGGKYNCQVWKQAKSYTASGTEKGVLNEGVNYFYCQQNLGRRETSGQWTNVWWAKTDDDSGNTDVFVSDVYIEGGDNDQPVPGLPVC